MVLTRIQYRFDYPVVECTPELTQFFPIYFIQLVTPTEQIYSNVEDVLFSEGLKMFSLLAGTMGCYCGSNSFSYQMEQNSKQRSENENTGVV
jgi:hypothetical protein